MTVATLVAAVTVVVQCSPAPPAAGPTSSPSISTTAAPNPEIPRTITRPRTPTRTTPVTAPAAVYPVTATELGATWRPGCPVPPERLRRVNLDYLGFDGRTHRGDLVVAEGLVGDVIDVFAELYRLRFPIERMRTVDHYPGAEDELSMRDDNTSAFNCRRLPSGSGWSLHALGRAVDVNPLLNPYVDSRGNLEPATAGPFVDRSRRDPGMLHAGDPAVRAFTSRGWRWGGDWRTPKDYQHFEKR
ncbi:M15 family metallopeptidase [Mycolicibacterium lacusdiani]|uniref:M15 family metallopeptidase n=1 Tax=Mycolicibacterium lacusdiani TaxID=2895283 RepID=UPI001F2C9D86|nr:M15 family metallopeptidase [Mycolicibacterium lacusdiani]